MVNAVEGITGVVARVVKEERFQERAGVRAKEGRFRGCDCD